jgi:RNA polymerase sigma-70 factor (ECF subfamily)
VAPADPARWFAEEVHAHDLALKAYLRRSFPAVRDVEDVVQESYLRIWKARMARPIASTKTFLFQIARHLVVDGVRRAQVARTESLGDLAALAVMEDRPDAVDAITYAEKVSLLAGALASLPARCRAIMIMRKFQNLSHAEIAARLGISERTVESQVTRGMKLIAVRLREKGLDGFSCDGS